MLFFLIKISIIQERRTTIDPGVFLRKDFDVEVEARKKSGKLRANIVRGLAVLFPVYLTFLLLRFLIRAFSKPLTPAFRWLAEEYDLTMITGSALAIESLIVAASLAVTLILLAIVGAIAQKVIGRKIVSFFESLLEKVPLIRTIYRTFRELTRIMTGEAAHTYKKVVYLNLWDDSGKALGFITGSVELVKGDVYHTVFVPTAPNITSGYLLLLKPDQYKETSITPEDGLRIIISAGVLSQKTDNLI